MMRKTLFILLFAFASLVQAQSLNHNATLFTVADQAVTVGEFMYVFNKNKDVGHGIDPKSPREYLQLYSQFKQKVALAESAGKDTLAQFLREYNGYYRELLKPYMSDRKSDEKLLQETYARMQTDVRASHIMFDLPENALPADTARIYKQLMVIKKRIIRGEPFEVLAKHVSSDSYSASRGGDLGWFNVFAMVYDFESACYQANQGEIVGPIRSQFGYHLIKVTGRRPARYQVEVAHIFMPAKDEESAAEALPTMQEVHQKLLDGEHFGYMARKYSKDITSTSKGGTLKPFGLNEMLPAFEDAAFGIENDGDFTAPIRSSMGWHIIQRLALTEVPDLERVQGNLKTKIRRDDRSRSSQKAYIARLRKDYGLKVHGRSLDAVMNAMELEKSTTNMHKVALSFDGLKGKVTLSQAEFAAMAGQGLPEGFTKEQVYGQLDRLIEGLMIKEAEKRLPIENDAFRYLAQEYREGILVFDLMREEVWDYAMDSSRLQAFFNENQANYQWADRYSGTLFTLDKEGMAKQAVKMLNQGTPTEKVMRVLQAKDALAVVSDDYENLEVGQSTPSEKAAIFLSYAALGDSVTGPIQHGKGWVVAATVTSQPAGPKALDECKGKVVSDLQASREIDWLSSLGQDFPVSVNESTWKKLLASGGLD